MAKALRDQLLHACFDRADTVFAGGDKANNKLDFDHVWWYPKVLGRVVTDMSKMIEKSGFDPELFVPVPEGANQLARELTRKGRYGAVSCMILDKDPVTRNISLPDGDAAYLEVDRVAIIEDVPNKLTTIRKVLALPGMMDREVAVYGVWDRGDPTSREFLPNGIELHSLISEHIPVQLPEDSPLWEFAATPVK